MSRALTSAIVLACAAVVLWLSQGTLAMTGAGDGRIAVLPLSFGAGALAALVVAALAAARGRGVSYAPLVLLLFPLLAWIPGASSPLLLLWSGGLGLLVWVAVALAMLAPAGRPRWPRVRPELAAALIAAAVYLTAAWQVSPSVPGGDEPHYLVITQSLLLDHDLKIENNHRRGDYRAYFAGQLSPDFRRRGRDGQIYSVHMPGVSALVAPAFFIGGYPAVVVFLIALAAAGAALAWHLAWRVTGRRDAAWFGWAAVTLSTTAIFHSFTVYPDGPAGVATLTGIWGLLRADEERHSGAEKIAPWFWHGAALATLPWLHQRFATVAGCLGALVLLRLARAPNAAGKAVAFLVAPALSALAWVSFFVAIYGTPDPTAPFGDEVRSLGFIPGALTALLFDQRFGLLAYAPVLVFAFGGLLVMLGQRAGRRLALELLFTLVPYLLVVTDVAMWWGGRSAPARFVEPVLLLMAIPAAWAWASMRSRTARYTAAGALAFSLFAAAVLVGSEGGRLAYNARETYRVPGSNGSTAISISDAGCRPGGATTRGRSSSEWPCGPPRSAPGGACCALSSGGHGRVRRPSSRRPRPRCMPWRPCWRSTPRGAWRESAGGRPCRRSCRRCAAWRSSRGWWRSTWRGPARSRATRRSPCCGCTRRRRRSRAAPAATTGRSSPCRRSRPGVTGSRPAARAEAGG